MTMNDVEYGNNGNSHHEDVEALLKHGPRQDGIGGNISSTNLSVIKHMFLGVPERYKDSAFWLIASFLDEDEAQDHVDAYHEALELGMDTTWNVDSVLARAAAYRVYKGVNRISEILNALSSFRYTTNQSNQQKNWKKPEEHRSAL